MFLYRDQTLCNLFNPFSSGPEQNHVYNLDKWLNCFPVSVSGFVLSAFGYK